MSKRHYLRTLAQLFIEREEADFDLRAGIEYDFDDMDEVLDRFDVAYVLDGLREHKEPRA